MNISTIDLSQEGVTLTAYVLDSSPEMENARIRPAMQRRRCSSFVTIKRSGMFIPIKLQNDGAAYFPKGNTWAFAC